jgi:hypothetical protein
LRHDFFAATGCKTHGVEPHARDISALEERSGHSMTVLCRYQTLSLRLSRSFTACGLALPPDAFMT